MPEIGKKMEEAVFTPALAGAIDAGVIGFSTAGTMLWNALQKDKSWVWAFGELLVTILIGSSLKVGRVRDIAFGIESGAIATLLMPVFYAIQGQKTTGARVGGPAVRPSSLPVLTLTTPPQKGVGSTTQPVPRGVSVLDI